MKGFAVGLALAAFVLSALAFLGERETQRRLRALESAAAEERAESWLGVGRVAAIVRRELDLRRDLEPRIYLVNDRGETVPYAGVASVGTWAHPIGVERREDGR